MSETITQKTFNEIMLIFLAFLIIGSIIILLVVYTQPQDELASWWKVIR